MSNTHIYTFEVKGMSCQHCVKAVTQAVQALDPSAQVAVDLGTGSVKVETTLAREAAAQAIVDEGYETVG